jgi:hypothetical protein
MSTRPKLERDWRHGVPCAPEHVLRLVVEGVVVAPWAHDATLPPGAPVGTVFAIGVSPFWVGYNRGCFQDRPNDLILMGSGLSRNSCSFTLAEGVWYAKDWTGTTPLTVNGAVADWTPVHPGDEVCLGIVRCRAQ